MVVLYLKIQPLHESSNETLLGASKKQHIVSSFLNLIV